MKKPFWIVIIVVWIVGILFPMAWFSNQFSYVSELFNRIFAPQWVHIGMHAGLYAVLMVLLSQLGNKKNSISVYMLWIIIGLIALTQETLQTFLAGRTLSQYELFDLFVDFCGAMFGRSLFWFLNQRSAVIKISEF